MPCSASTAEPRRRPDDAQPARGRGRSRADRRIDRIVVVADQLSGAALPRSPASRRSTSCPTRPEMDARAAIGEHVERIVIALPRPARRRSRISSTHIDRAPMSLTGVRTFVVDSRYDRLNRLPLASVVLPGWPRGAAGTTRWFQNRWPAMPDDRCGRAHRAARRDLLWSPATPRARKVIDLYRPDRRLGRAPTSTTLVFENAAPRSRDHHTSTADYALRRPAAAASSRAALTDAGRTPRRGGAGLARLGARGAGLPVRRPPRARRARA